MGGGGWGGIGGKWENNVGATGKNVVHQEKSGGKMHGIWRFSVPNFPFYWLFLKEVGPSKYGVIETW